MLKVGVIGYGLRARDVLRSMNDFSRDGFGIPFTVAALADPRGPEIRKLDDPWLVGCEYFDSAEPMLAKADLDGIFIGTRCNLHAEMACKAAGRKLPVFLEKPIALSFEQLAALERAFAGHPAPVVVSFPLRLTPLVQKVKQLVDDGAIGAIEHMVAVNDVPYGRVYFNSWYRDYDVTGGLFLQKATHDFDTLNYLLGRRPVQVAAMAARRVYGGDMPHDMRCRNCPKLYTCPESSFTLFYETYTYWRNEPVADDWCVFSREIKDQDCGNVLLEYDNGVQAAYAQNFFVRHKAARRGAKLMGFKGSIEFDFVTGRINVYNHRKPDSATHDFTFPANLIHTGGDRELAFDFLMAMKERRPSRSPLEAGLLSVLTCLRARESAEKRQFLRVEMPKGG